MKICSCFSQYEGLVLFITVRWFDHILHNIPNVAVVNSEYNIRSKFAIDVACIVPTTVNENGVSNLNKASIITL